MKRTRRLKGNGLWSQELYDLEQFRLTDDLLRRAFAAALRDDMRMLWFLRLFMLTEPA